MTCNNKNLFKLNIVNGTIQFSNVSFNYPSRPDVRVLSGIDFKVSDGQKVALVGSSGCGKSTIVKLLLKLYDCDDGQVSSICYNVRTFSSQFHFRSQLMVQTLNLWTQVTSDNL